MLTDTELDKIDSIAWLEAKQADPTVNRSEALVAPSAPPKYLNIGNYPSWEDPRCHSNGEYFCDPDHLLSIQERANLTEAMKKLRAGQQITCGLQMQSKQDAIEKWHYEPFYLGVAIAKNWPLHELDHQSLQNFGQILAGRWNMTGKWRGNPSFYARCPNEAVLIILPEKRQVHLSSPSCMFLCEEKGGPEVQMATVLGLDSDGLMAGALAGMSEVYKAIAKSSPMHKPGWKPAERVEAWDAWNRPGAWLAPGADAVHDSLSFQSPSANLDENLWSWAQRILFGLTVLMFVGSLFVALLVCYLAPGMAKQLNKSVV